MIIEMFVGERSRQYAVEELAEKDRLRSLRWIQVHGMAWLETSHLLDSDEIPAWALAERDLHLRERTRALGQPHAPEHGYRDARCYSDRCSGCDEGLEQESSYSSSGVDSKGRGRGMLPKEADGI